MSYQFALLTLCNENLFSNYILFFLRVASSQNISGIINSYASVTGITGSNITVVSTAGFAVGDQIMIVQMQSASIITANNATFGSISAMGGAGVYEYENITAIACRPYYTDQVEVKSRAYGKMTKDIG